jgi:hypothetical protein
MKVHAGSALPAPSDAEITRFQERHGVQLPSEFIEFLRTANAGVPVDAEFPQGGQVRLIERLLGIIEDYSTNPLGEYDLRVVMQEVGSALVAREDMDRVGARIIPFGQLFAGDLVCLDFRDNPRIPTIAVWQQDLPDEWCPAMFTVANTFRDFEVMLKEYSNAKLSGDPEAEQGGNL